MLTARQAQLLGFIETYTREHGGVSPSFGEMSTALGLRSKSGIHRLLEALEDRGAIKRMTNRARSIVVRSVEEVTARPLLTIDLAVDGTVEVRGGKPLDDALAAPGGAALRVAIYHGIDAALYPAPARKAVA